jgi:hypothetical protein
MDHRASLVFLNPLVAVYQYAKFSGTNAHRFSPVQKPVAIPIWEITIIGELIIQHVNPR